MSEFLLDRTSAVLSKVLDGTAARQRALANNIANAETPGYQRQDVTFATQLRDVIDQSTLSPDRGLRAVQEVSVDVADDPDAAVHANGNSVSVETEMTEVARNSLQYETAATMLRMKFAGLRFAISEGRR